MSFLFTYYPGVTEFIVVGGVIVVVVAVCTDLKNAVRPPPIQKEEDKFWVRVE